MVYSFKVDYGFPLGFQCNQLFAIDYVEMTYLLKANTMNLINGSFLKHQSSNFIRSLEFLIVAYRLNLSVLIQSSLTFLNVENRILEKCKLTSQLIL